MPTQYVFPTSNLLRYRFPTHTNDLVMDRSQASASEVFVVVLEPGEAPPMHKHHDTEQIFHITEGRGRLEIGTRVDDPAPQRFEVGVGDVVRIPVNAPHRIHCMGDKRLVYLAIDCFPGGRPGAEPTWDSHVRVLCREQGWDYDKVVQRNK
jgi:mannose-6-phosphate isomerase-like protein (cupin superfamily)